MKSFSVPTIYPSINNPLISQYSAESGELSSVHQQVLELSSSSQGLVFFFIKSRRCPLIYWPAPGEWISCCAVVQNGTVITTKSSMRLHRWKPRTLLPDKAAGKLDVNVGAKSTHTHTHTHTRNHTHTHTLKSWADRIGLKFSMVGAGQRRHLIFDCHWYGGLHLWTQGFFCCSHPHTVMHKDAHTHKSFQTIPNTSVRWNNEIKCGKECIKWGTRETERERADREWKGKRESESWQRERGRARARENDSCVYRLVNTETQQHMCLLEFDEGLR